MSPVGEQLLRESEGFGGDGTWGSCPITKHKRVSPKQLYVIMARVRGTSVPVMWMIMEGMSAEDYYLAFNAVLSPLITTGWQPRYAIFDFEQAPVNALNRLLPDLQIRRCLVHLKRSLSRKFQKLGLKSLFNSSALIRWWVGSFGNTALLPLAEVMPAMYALRNWIARWISLLPDVSRRAGRPSMKERVRTKVKKWLRYVEATYRRLYPPAQWNAYQPLMDGEPWTTNDNESYNRALGFQVGKSRPSLSRCIVLLRAEEEKVHRRLEAVGDGPLVLPNPRSRHVSIIRKLREAIRAFETIPQKSEEDRISLLLELHAIRQGHVDAEAEPQPDDVDDSESSDDDEEENGGLPIVNA
jgi:MULE transposase domain